MAIGHTPGGTGHVVPNDPNHPVVTPQDTVSIAYTVDARFREQAAKADAALQAAEAVMGMAGIGASSPIDSQTAALVRSTTTLTHDAVRSVVQEVGVQARPLGLHAEDLGVKGNGIADDTTAFHAAAAEAVKQGVPLVLRAGMTVTISAYKQLPDHLVLHTNGAVFRQQTPMGRNPVIGFGRHPTVVGGLHVRTLGGDNCQGVLLNGSNQADIDAISVEADAPAAGAASVRDNAVRIMGSNRARIGRVDIKNYDWPGWVEGSSDVFIGRFTADTYCLALRIKDCSLVHIQGGQVQGKSPNAAYKPGWNGILLEADTDQRGIVVENFTVLDAGEHGYRIGGQSWQSDITFRNCAAVGVGGSGFKILPGPAGTTNIRAYNVRFVDPKVVDAGLLNQNCCGFLIQRAEGVYITSPHISAGEQAFSAVEGIRMSDASHVTVSDAKILDTQKFAVHLDESFGGVEDVRIDGHVQVTSGQGVYLQNPGVRFHDIHVDMFVENTAAGGSAFYAGRSTAAEDSGSWTGMNTLRLEISESTPSTTSINPNSSTAGLSAFFADVIGRRAWIVPFRPGSMWTDTRTLTRQVKRADDWAVL